jgi:hexosaminidase
MTYPRAFAISESLWSPLAGKDYKNFLGRTEVHFDRFDQAGRSIAKTIYEPEVIVKMEGRKMMCTLKSSFEDIEVKYTIDNTYPVGTGMKYTEAFEVPQGDLKLRAQSYRDGEPIGRMLIIDRKDLEARVK